MSCWDDLFRARDLSPTWRKPQGSQAPSRPLCVPPSPQLPHPTTEDPHHRNEDMGLFSSRKADDSDTHLTTPTPPSADNDKSVVHVIRSRFVRPGVSRLYWVSLTADHAGPATSSTARTKARSALRAPSRSRPPKARRLRKHSPARPPRLHMPLDNPAPSRKPPPRHGAPAPAYYASRRRTSRCLRSHPGMVSLRRGAWVRRPRPHQRRAPGAP